MHRLSYFCLWGFIVAVLAGCGSAPRARLAAPKQDTVSRLGVSATPPPRISGGTSMVAVHARYAQAVIDELDGNEDLALGEFYDAAWADPSNEWLMLDVTRRFIEKRKLDKAAQLLSRAASQPDASPEVLARLALVYGQLGKSEDSERFSQAALKHAPQNLAVYQNLFLLHMQHKQEREALAVLDAAGKLPRPTAEFRIGISELYVTYGLHVPDEKAAANAKALALLQAAKKAGVKAPLQKLKLADGFAMLSQTDTAAELYLELLSSPAAPPGLQENVHAKLANIYLRSSDRNKAADQLKALIKSEPTNPQPYYFLGNVAFDEQKPAEAADYFSKTIVLSPDFEQAYYELANAQLAMGKPSEALSTLEKAREKFAAGFAMEFFTAIASARLKDYEAAIKHFTAAEVIAKATDPKRLNYIFYFQLGAVYEERKDYKEAETALLRCLELSPDFPDALNYLGYMWADQGVHLEKAAEMLEKAVKAAPKNGAFLDSLGWAYYKLGRFQEALKLIRSAVELSGEPDAVLLEHLGDVYLSVGEKQKARETWEKSYKVEPRAEVKSKLEKNP